MLVWWFAEGVLGRSTQPRARGSQHTPRNESFPNYLVWHPRDHASFTLERPAAGPLPAGSGATIRIIEVLMARQPYLLPADSLEARRTAEIAADDVFVDSRNLVTRLDQGGTEMEARLPLSGRAALRLTHEWSDGPGGARLRSTMRLGAAAGALHSPPLRMLMDVEKVGRRWMAHCVEEFGNFEHFLPKLFYAAQRASA
ncbi:hypothetical protein WJX81_006370 [Elliptochloris bilobata]|uniref:Coenzyme Q-binding protein COQ10 START domain-containing protein n=1 Tax=Elliptochloris bilobata TaxID=381761 RepID=A0AAW1SHW4_9CHLO